MARTTRKNSSMATQRPGGSCARTPLTAARRLAAAVSRADFFPLIASIRSNSSNRLVLSHLSQAVRMTSCAGFPIALRPAGDSPSFPPETDDQPRRLEEARPRERRGSSGPQPGSSLYSDLSSAS